MREGNRLGAERAEGLYDARIGRLHLCRDGRDRQGQGPPRHSAFILERGMQGFSVGKKENKLGMRASDTATLIPEKMFACRVKTSSPRKARVSNRSSRYWMVVASELRRWRLAWRRARPGGEPALRQGTATVRQADRRVSGRSMEDRRHGNGDRSGAPPDAQGGLAKNERTMHQPCGFAGEIFPPTRWRPRGRRGGADSMAGMVYQRLPGGKVLPRCKTSHHRRGDFGSAKDDHRQRNLLRT